MALSPIEEILQSMTQEERSKVVTYIKLLSSNRAGRMKIIPYQGIDLGDFSKRFIGDGMQAISDYKACVCDAIYYVQGMSSDEPIGVCNESDKRIIGYLHPSKATNFEKMETLLTRLMGNPVVDGSQGESVDDGLGDENSEGAEDESPDEQSDSSDDKSDDSDSEEDFDTTPNPNEVGIRKAIEEWVGGRITPLVGKVLSAYKQVLESGFDLERPYGVIDENGIDYIDSECVFKVRGNINGDLDKASVIALGGLFFDTIGCAVSDSRSPRDVAVDLYEGYSRNQKVYFPRKILEYAFGRKPSKKPKDVNYRYCTKDDQGISSNWGKYCDLIIKPDVTITLKDAACIYCNEALKLEGESYDKANEVLKSKWSELLGYLEYVTCCLSYCFMIMSYKCVGGNPVSIRIRACDPDKTLSKITVKNIVDIVASGNTGGSSSATAESSLNAIDSELIGVYEYSHEFDHVLANGMPLFAYKAFESIKEKGETVSFNSLVLGQSNDGTTLRNNTHGLKLANSLYHYIIAGSRSGKGVMTLNFLIGALLSNKAIFYIDNKPDMASMLSLLAGGNTASGPAMFAVNGDNFEDDKQKQFVHCDSWINPANIPMEAITILGEPKWREGYGVMFYMRALTLVLSIIFARGRDGGKGHMDDPEFNGEDGIFLVCDEINKLQDAFSKRIAGVNAFAKYVPAQSGIFANSCFDLEKAYRGTQAEKPSKNAESDFISAKNSFSRDFTAAMFYALSYFNMLNDNIDYIDGKKKAGFLRKEMELSDILLIGQNVEIKPMSLGTLSEITGVGRYASKGRGDSGLPREAKGNLAEFSIPMSHFVFSSADALIGFNSEHQEYLAQSDESSKAHGKLDEVASNFCYIPHLDVAFETAAGKTLTKAMANRPENVYFKPYLILNDCDEGVKKGYVDQMYTRVAKAGITPEKLVSVYGDGNGHLNPAIGIPGYAQMLGISDIPQRLQKGANIANLVLSKYVGYPDDGSGRPLWLQFVTDLRPEWMLSITDIAGKCCGDPTNLDKGRSNPILKEYYGYVDFITSHSEYGITDNTMSSSGSIYTDSEGNIQHNISGYESNDRRDYFDSIDDYDSEAAKVSSSQRYDAIFDGSGPWFDEEEQVDGNPPEGISEDTAPYEDLDTVVEGLFDEDYGPDYNEEAASSATDHSNPSDVASDQYERWIDLVDSGDSSANPVSAPPIGEEIDISGAVSDFFNGTQNSAQASTQGASGGAASVDTILDMLENGTLGNDLPQSYTVNPSQRGVVTGYQAPPARMQINPQRIQNIEFDAVDEGVAAQSFAQLITEMTNSVIRAYGGLDRIRSFAVIGGGIAINGTIFRSRISNAAEGVLPLDVRRTINSGNIAHLFDYSKLRKMPNLLKLHFDSPAFVFDVVSPMMRYRGTIGVNNFFNDIPSLQVIKVGFETFDRSNYREQLKRVSVDGDLYYRHSAASKFSEACQKKMSGFSKGSWKFTKNMFTTKDHNVFVKTLGILAGTVGMAVGGAATVVSAGAVGVSHLADNADRDHGKLRALQRGISSLFNS